MHVLKTSDLKNSVHVFFLDSLACICNHVAWCWPVWHSGLRQVLRRLMPCTARLRPLPAPFPQVFLSPRHSWDILTHTKQHTYSYAQIIKVEFRYYSPFLKQSLRFFFLLMIAYFVSHLTVRASLSNTCVSTNIIPLGQHRFPPPPSGYPRSSASLHTKHIS